MNDRDLASWLRALHRELKKTRRSGFWRNLWLFGALVLLAYMATQ